MCPLLITALLFSDLVNVTLRFQRVLLDSNADKINYMQTMQNATEIGNSSNFQLSQGNAVTQLR